MNTLSAWRNKTQDPTVAIGCSGPIWDDSLDWTQQNDPCRVQFSAALIPFADGKTNLYYYQSQPVWVGLQNCRPRFNYKNKAGA